MRKKCMSFISLMTVLFMLFAVISPVSYAAEPDYYNLRVGGVLVTPQNKNNIPITKGKAEYDPESRELHLTNATINGYYAKNGNDICAVYTESDRFTISFTGDCVIDLSNAPKNYYPYGEAVYMNYSGIYGRKLYLSSYRKTSEDYYGKSLKIIGPDVNTGYGIYCYGQTEVDIKNADASVTVEGNKEADASWGIKCTKLSVNGGISNISGSTNAFSDDMTVNYHDKQYFVSGSKYQKEYDTVCDKVDTITDFWKNWKNITIRPLVDDSNFLNCIDEKLMGFDLDGNKALDADERAMIKEIPISAYTSEIYARLINNINGIERFPNLESLYIEKNKKIESINLSKNKKLIKLDCANCANLKSLDLSNNTELEELNCLNCGLTKLDLSKNTKLKKLYCDGNYSGSSNILGSLDVSACPLLEELYCSGTSIKTLKLGSKKNLEKLNCNGINSKLDAKLSSLDLTGCPNLKYIDCCFNNISSLNVSVCPKLTELNANYNELKSLNVSKNPELITLAAGGSFTSLDLSKNTKLKNLTLNEAGITSLNLTTFPELETAEITKTAISSLNTSKNPKLVKLDICDNTKMTSLDVSNNQKLQYLSCSNCSLTKLILGKHDNLEKFYCSKNNLTTLDISGLPLGKTETSYGAPYTYQMGNQKNAISVFTLSDRVDNIMYWLNTGAINSFNLKVTALNLTVPKIKSVTDTGSGVKAEWTPINAPVKYKISRSLSKDSGYSLISTVYNTSSFTDKSVVAGKDYYYKITAVTAEGKTKDSSPVKIHIHKYTTKTTKATLTKNGKTETKCSVCGKVTKTATVYYPKTIKLSATSYTYDGKVKKPTVKVTGSNGKVIASSNYTVSYASGRKNIGSYTVTVKFKGNYSGTKTLTFKIIPKNPTVTVKSEKKNATVSYKKISGGVKYQIQYSTKKSSGFKNVKTNTTALKVTKTKLTSKKTYYFRVRAYKKVGKTTYYSSWTTKSVKIK